MLRPAPAGDNRPFESGLASPDASRLAVKTRALLPESRLAVKTRRAETRQQKGEGPYMCVGTGWEFAADSSRAPDRPLRLVFIRGGSVEQVVVYGDRLVLRGHRLSSLACGHAHRLLLGLLLR